ncbi:hypothetical protein SRHO_G00323950 [Serrasalmus rhombeus]
MCTRCTTKIDIIPAGLLLKHSHYSGCPTTTAVQLAEQQRLCAWKSSTSRSRRGHPRHPTSFFYLSQFLPLSGSSMSDGECDFFCFFRCC